MKLALALAALALTTAACTSQPTAMNKPEWRKLPSRIPAMSPLPPFVPNENINYDCKAELERTASREERFELKYEAKFQLFTKKGGEQRLHINDSDLVWKLAGGDEKTQPVNANPKGQGIAISFTKKGTSFIPSMQLNSTETSEDGTKDISGYTKVTGQAKKGSVLNALVIFEERNNWSKGEPTGLGMNSTSLEVTCTRTE